jgi:hypothetical protein
MLVGLELRRWSLGSQAMQFAVLENAHTVVRSSGSAIFDHHHDLGHVFDINGAIRTAKQVRQWTR